MFSTYISFRNTNQIRAFLINEMNRNLFYSPQALTTIPNQATVVDTANVIINEIPLDELQKQIAKEEMLGTDYVLNKGNLIRYTDNEKENYYVDTPKFDKNSKISERNCKIYVKDIEFSKNINWLFTSENFRYNIKTLNGLIVAKSNER